jgi:hypothetical protein
MRDVYCLLADWQVQHGGEFYQKINQLLNKPHNCLNN